MQAIQQQENMHRFAAGFDLILISLYLQLKDLKSENDCSLIRILRL